MHGQTISLFQFKIVQNCQLVATELFGLRIIYWSDRIDIVMEYYIAI